MAQAGIHGMVGAAIRKWAPKAELTNILHPPDTHSKW
jgi:hypothetical protein